MQCKEKKLKQFHIWMKYFKLKLKVFKYLFIVNNNNLIAL